MEKLKVTILYDAVEDAVRDEAKAKGEKPRPLVYEEVRKALADRGHTVKLLAAETKVKGLAAQIDKDDSDVIFNICESLGGVGQHEQNVAALLELFGKRFTGAGAIGLALAQDKALAKKVLHFDGVRTPKFSVIEGGEVDHADELAFPMFVKPANADASIGIDSRSVVHSFKELMERISYIQTEFQAPALIEEFIDGREIYVGILGGDRPEALPILEWDFSKVPKDMPKIASTEAKWDESNPAYRNTPQVFPTDIPAPVCKAIQDAALDAFRSLKLRDYGRIDMRLRQTATAGRKSRNGGRKDRNGKDKDGGGQEAGLDGWEFFLIEANPNPHLAGDGEFASAAREHGVPYPDLIERILELALARTR